MDDKKRDIIPIAIRLFSEKGYDATSVEEIAKKSGMAKGSFYKIFNSKEELLLDIFLTIPEQIKLGLTQIYSRSYHSNNERLVDFVAVCFENILSHHTKLLMDTMFSNILLKSNAVEAKATQMMQEFHAWIEEFLLELYGEKIKDYTGDLISLLHALLFHYAHLFNSHQYDIQKEKLAKFIATLFDITVSGLLERKPEALLPNKCLALTPHESPRIKGQKIQALLKQMEITLKSLKLIDEEDYLKTLAMLEQKCFKSHPEAFLIKALLHYLQAIPQIQEECEALKQLLEIT